MAAPARWVDRDAVADLKVRCGSRDLHHLAGNLMAEHQRRLHHEIAGPGMTEVMHVRAADAAGAEADAHHAGCEFFERMLDHAQIFGAEQGSGESCGGHFESPMFWQPEGQFWESRFIAAARCRSGPASSTVVS